MRSKAAAMFLLELIICTGCSSKVNVDSMHSPDPLVRRRAVAGLGDGRDQAGLTALVQAMRNDPAVEVREEAARALGQLGDRKATPALLEEAAGTGDVQVRHAAVQALVRLQDPAAIPGLIGLWQLERGQEDGVVHLDAKEALMAIGAPAVPPLIAALKHDSWNVRWFSLETLGRLKPAEAVEAITAMKSDPSQVVRLAADKALQRLQEK